MSKLITQSAHVVVQDVSFAISRPTWPGVRLHGSLIAHVTGNGKTIIVPIDNNRVVISADDMRELLGAQQSVVNVSLYTSDP
jgi:hypothetical protein